MNLALIEDRLRDQVASLKEVGGGAELSALQGRKPSRENQPAAYVVLIGEKAKTNAVQMAVRQEVTITFGIVLVFGSQKDARGKTATAKILAERASVRAALLGHQPEPELDAIEFVEGKLIGLTGGVVWWMDTYRTSELIGST